MRHQLGTDLLRFVAFEFVLAILDAVDQLIAKPGFLADLPDGAADPVHVVRGRSLRMLLSSRRADRQSGVKPWQQEKI